MEIHRDYVVIVARDERMRRQWRVIGPCEPDKPESANVQGLPDLRGVCHFIDRAFLDHYLDVRLQYVDESTDLHRHLLR